MSAEMGGWPEPEQQSAADAVAVVVVGDSDVLDRAESAVERAQTRVRTERRRLTTAEKAVEDAAGVLHLARVRLEEHRAGRVPEERAEDDAKSTGLAEAVRRAERRLLAAEEAIEDRLAEVDVAEAAAQRAERSLDRKRAAAAEVAMAGPAEEQEPAQLRYKNVEEFVTEHLASLFRRKPRTWCPAWWNHPEAVVRLDALWTSWEQLRLEAGTGMSVWLRDHYDHHMSVLTSDDGPLMGCTPEYGHTERGADPLKLVPVPPGLFDNERDSASTP